MTFESYNKELKNNEGLFYDNEYLNPNANNNNCKDNVINFISNNSQEIMNNNFYKFVKGKSYKEINNDNTKYKLFFFTCFINSCKSYKDIKELNRDIKVLFKNKIIDNYDYYYNIISNYLNNVLEIITTESNFFKNEQNCEKLLNILKNIDNISYINTNGFHDIIFRMLDLENKILNVLKKNNINNDILRSINILKKQINYLNNIENYNKNEKIILHFDTYNKNIPKDDKNNLSKSNEEKDEYSSLNKACFININSIENNGLNTISENLLYKNKTNNKKEIKEKKEYQTSFNYENLMCPPIKDDSD
jgi:hypothetical protein